MANNLLLNNDFPPMDQIQDEFGEKSSPLWLIINPNYLEVRYDIWLPILEVVQEQIFRKLKQRIDSQKIYTKYALSDIGLASGRIQHPGKKEELSTLKENISVYQPKLLITFGSMSYELINRLCAKETANGAESGSRYWSTADLVSEFEQAIKTFDISRTNKIPLPRRVITSVKPAEDYDTYWQECQGYFLEVGKKIAERIIENKDELNIWIE